MDNLPLQTLQIYKIRENIPIETQIRKIACELQSIKINYPRRTSSLGFPLYGRPEVKNIDWENILTKIDEDLSFWIEDYRYLVDKICELDRVLPKNRHILQESDEQAQENVIKISKCEEIRKTVLNQFKRSHIQYEENIEKLERRINQLDSQLLEAQSKVENLEYRMKKNK